jgi:hypothetical protein
MDRVQAPINHCFRVIEGAFTPALVEYLQHAVDSAVSMNGDGVQLLPGQPEVGAAELMGP